MADDNKPDAQRYVSSSGLFAGLHPTMGIASKAMVLSFVIFTVLNVDFANSIYDAVKSWIHLPIQLKHVRQMFFYG
jgi:choline/glycine/proline betaine transport protein